MTLIDHGSVLAERPNCPGDRRHPWHWASHGNCTGRSRSRHCISAGTSSRVSTRCQEHAKWLTFSQRDTSNLGTKEQIEQLGRKVSIYTADLASQQSVSQLVATVIQDGHDIDILLNCAGIQRRHPSHLFPDNDWDEVSLRRSHDSIRPEFGNH